jgi:hypothetical protein
MIQLAVVAAAAAVVGGVVAITPRDSRLVALGLVVAMVATPLASSPQPTALAVAFRILGSVLAAYFLWAATRDRSIESEGSGIGAAGELIAAAAAFSIGWFVTPVRPMAGPVAAQAAGLALIALAIVPLAGRNVLRVGAGIVLLLLGISLLLEAWVGPGSSLRQVVLTVLLVGTVGATSLLLSPTETAAVEREDAAVEPGTAEPTEGAVESVKGEAAEPGPDGLAIGLPRSEAVPEASTGAPVEAAAAHATAPVAAPVAAPSAPKRVSTARTSKPRALRASRVAAPDAAVEGAGSVADETPSPPEPSAKLTPAPSRERRPNPREQRKPRVRRKADGPPDPQDSGR